MSPDSPIYIFPQATSTTYIALVLVAFALLGVALLLEGRRRRQQERMRLEAEWHGVDAIIRDKELAEDQAERLRDLIRRYGAEHPYKLVTQRALFDRAVHEEIQRIRPGASVATLEETGAELRLLRGMLGLEFVPLAQSIQSTRDLYRGQKIWMGLPGSGRGNPEWHQFVVREVDEAFFFATPEQDKMPAVREGAAVRCKMWREDDGRYAFETQVARASNQPAGWLLQHSGDLARTQARAFFRVPFDQPADLDVVPVPVSGDIDELRKRPETMRIKGRLTSLSAGGFAATVSQPLPQQMALRTLLKLNTGVSMEAVGKIVGMQELYGGRYLIRCAFAGLTEEERDAIAHYVSLWQRRAQQDPESGR
ncbi:MAG: hypothetical protein GC168_01130 [Candidatus Hydrogenedens sp.]|nr:hypothetical protein [Candidatus Hydrogenedens sp.]